MFSFKCQAGCTKCKPNDLNINSYTYCRYGKISQIVKVNICSTYILYCEIWMYLNNIWIWKRFQAGQIKCSICSYQHAQVPIRSTGQALSGSKVRCSALYRLWAQRSAEGPRAMSWTFCWIKDTTKGMKGNELDTTAETFWQGDRRATWQEDRGVLLPNGGSDGLHGERALLRCPSGLEEL